MRYVFIDPSADPPPEAVDVEALLIWNIRSGYLRENWSDFKRLRWVHAGTAGVERVLFPELVASDVVLTNSRYVFDEALAEYTIGLMLALSKDLSDHVPVPEANIAGCSARPRRCLERSR